MNVTSTAAGDFSDFKVNIPMSKGKRSALVFAIYLAISSQMMMTYSLTTAAPTIVQALNGWQFYALLFSLATLFQALFSPVQERLAKVITNKGILVGGVALFIVQFIMTWVAQSVPFIIIARCIGGIGAAAIFVVGVALFADLFPPNERAKYTGLYASVMALTGVLAPTVAGYIVDHWSWRYTTVIPLVLGVVALLMFLVLVPKTPKTSLPSFDGKGLVWLSLSMIAIVSLFSFAGIYFKWASWITAVLAVAFILFFVIFVNTEKKVGDSALFPIGLLKHPVFVAGFLLGFCGDGAAYVARIWIPAYAQVAMGTDATVSGLLVSIPSIFAIVCGWLTGRWLAKTGRLKFMALACVVIQTLMYAFLPLGGTVVNTTVYMIGLTLLFGFTNGVVAYIPFALVQARMPERFTWMAVAACGLGINIGCAIVVTVAGIVQNAFPTDPLVAFRWIFVLGAVFSILPLPLILRLRSDKAAAADKIAEDAAARAAFAEA